MLFPICPSRKTHHCCPKSCQRLPPSLPMLVSTKRLALSAGGSPESRHTMVRHSIIALMDAAFPFALWLLSSMASILANASAHSSLGAEVSHPTRSCKGTCTPLALRAMLAICRSISSVVSALPWFGAFKSSLKN